MNLMRRVLSTREGTIAFAVLAAVLAAVVLMAFTRGYKHSVERNGEEVTVLVAKDALPKGSPGDVIAEKGLIQTTGFARDQVKDGAITDPATLRGMVAAHPIVRGQQITIGDFVKPTDPVLSRLSDERRAITIPLGSAHGMIGRIHAGDHVDVLSGFQVQPDGAGRPRPAADAASGRRGARRAAGRRARGLGASASQTQNVTLRLSEKAKPELAFASDNGKVWIVLRAQAGAKQSAMSLVTLDRLLLRTRPDPRRPLPVEEAQPRPQGLSRRGPRPRRARRAGGRLPPQDRQAAPGAARPHPGRPVARTASSSTPSRRAPAPSSSCRPRWGRRSGARRSGFASRSRRRSRGGAAPPARAPTRCRR